MKHIIKALRYFNLDIYHGSSSLTIVIDLISQLCNLMHHKLTTSAIQAEIMMTLIGMLQPLRNFKYPAQQSYYKWFKLLKDLFQIILQQAYQHVKFFEKKKKKIFKKFSNFKYQFSFIINYFKYFNYL